MWNKINDMLQNISFLICLCDKTYKKPCFSAEKCYIIWLNRAFACIFAAVKNKKAILSEGEALFISWKSGVGEKGN